MEQIYSVSADTQGSWVALCVDPKGRLIVGDQTGGLFRVWLKSGSVTQVEPLDLDIGYVNGLTYAFGSLYAVVAEDHFQGGGLYRARDNDGDDQFETVDYLRDFVAKGEHGPHSVVPGPEGKSLYVISGNKTPIPDGPGFRSNAPEHWGEDDLLPRLWGPIGSEKGTPAPGGWIARTDPEGLNWELIAIGLRNGFDLAFNQSGDLFTTDADAEFDMGTPWYQPTRLFHVVAGTDFGWRSGSGKWQPYFADTLPPLYEYGPGSPTGLAFGYEAKFPSKYKEALFACDWSWGRVFATWLSPEGASYKARTEEFMSGVPLPIADLVVNPVDGAMYFVLGGRGTSSGLYRIDYTGEFDKEGFQRFSKNDAPQFLARKKLEALVSNPDQKAVEVAWSYLSSSDRTLRHTARLILENASTMLWRGKAIAEPDPIARMTALLALARAGEGKALPEILTAILELDWTAFSADEQFLGLRCLEVALLRMAPELSEVQISTHLNELEQLLISHFPSGDVRLNGELLKLLVYLGSSEVTEKAMALLDHAISQEDLLRYSLPLRHQSKGWTPESRASFLNTIGRARNWKGGLSLTKYIEQIEKDALSLVPESEVEKYQAIIEKARRPSESIEIRDSAFLADWTIDKLLPIEESELIGRDTQKGRNAFTKAGCFNCHRVANEGGGWGPDLSAVMRRFSVEDLLDSVIDPGKVVSDQFGLTQIVKKNGDRMVGKVVNYYGEQIGFQSNIMDPASITRVPRAEIESIEPVLISPMPPGLLNTLERSDILDMIAFLRSESGL